MKLSVCGLCCERCEFYDTSCAGCYSVKGSAFWAAEMMPSQVCPLFDCAINQNHLGSCGECSRLPCDLFISVKDPSLTDEEHKRLIIIRCERLRKMQKRKG